MKGGVNRIHASLGIGYLGAVLRKAEHEVYIRDTALEGYNNEKPLDGRTIMIGETNMKSSRKWMRLSSFINLLRYAQF